MMLYLENLGDLFVDMSFYIVIGLIFTGLLHAFIKKDVILKHIGKDNTSSVMKASIFGVPLPLCSCGVVPTAMYLGKSGASKGAVVSFLTSTPQTGVDSIIATYGMMGPLFAAYRAVAAFLSGIICGTATNVLCKHDHIVYEDAPTTCGCHSHEAEQVEEPTHSCCCSHEHEAEQVEEPTHSCCCSHEQEAEQVEEPIHSCCCSHEQEAEPVEEPIHSCCCSHEQEAEPAEEPIHSCCCSHEHKATSIEETRSFGEKLIIAVKYAFGDFLDEIAGHFLIGLLIAALISTLLPDNILSSFTNPFISMILMVVIGIPMYICSTASIPIAVSLMMKGISPGAAFVFLFAGPVTNIASLTIILNTLGKKVTAIYLSSVAICAIAFGMIFDYIINASGYTGVYNMIHGAHEHGHPIYMIVVSILFGVLLLKSVMKGFMKKEKSSCCH